MCFKVFTVIITILHTSQYVHSCDAPPPCCLGWGEHLAPRSRVVIVML